LTKRIETLSPETGRMLLEDDTVINLANIIANILAGTTPVPCVLNGSLPSGGNLIGAIMMHGDVAMVMRDSGIDPTHLLGANETYKSEVIDRPRQDTPDGMTRLWVKSSSTGVLYLEEHNNYNPDNPDAGWTTLATVNVSATVSALMAWSTLTKQYTRFKFVNGAVAQTEFILNHYTQGVGVMPTMVADGLNVTLGVKNETPVTDPTASASVTARLGGILKQFQGDGPVGKAVPVKSSMEGFGATVATRPLATAVPIGFAFQSVATQEIWQSDGTNWVVI